MSRRRRAIGAEPIPLERFRVLIVCRGPIALEAMEVAAELGMPRPHLIVAKREVLESAEARAPWIEQTGLYERLHIVDDYRDQVTIVEVARRHGIQAIYVGYGYNAENADFIARIEAAGLIPLAPASDVMAFSGSKFRAKRWVRDELGIPVLPGSDRPAALALEPEADDESLLAAVEAEARALQDEAPGRLIRLKAVRSGGGKGQRLIRRPQEAGPAAREIWAEIGARGVNGDKGILVEINLDRPRHWEVQVLSDGETTVHFGARECSIQNVGSQKFIETSLHPDQYEPYLATLDPRAEAPLVAALREEQERIRRTCDHAARIIESLKYRGAATVEFLLADDGGPEPGGLPRFMEINSRIQVEHRVSEAVARVRGRPIRLVGEQFRIGAGHRLGYGQEDIRLAGYAIETRINAAHSNFLIGASGSVIETCAVPPTDENFTYDDGGARASFAAGRRRAWAVPNFDSNFGLAVFRGATPGEAFARAQALLERFQIRGNAQLRTTVPFHLGVLALLLASPPHGKIRTDFSEIYLALAALTHQALARIGPEAIDPADPLARLLRTGLARLKSEPSLALALAFRERRLRQANGPDGPAPIAQVVETLARLIDLPLFEEERRAAAGLADEYPPLIARLLSAVEASGGLEFTRRPESLEFEIPPSVRDPRLRRLLIEELRDRLVPPIEPRTLTGPELEGLRRTLEGLRARLAELVESEDLRARLEDRLQDGLEMIRTDRALTPEEFPPFYDALREIKWMLRKGGLDEAAEALLLAELGRALQVVRGPNLVAHLAGTIYLRPAPDKPPFAQVGQEVVEDETVVALLENMKMFNEIRAHMSGRIREIRVEDERPVLPGDVLMVIE